MIGLTVYSRSVNVILDRINVCGGPTTHRMQTVTRFARVCNVFLLASLAVAAIQLFALFSSSSLLMRYVHKHEHVWHVGIAQ